MHGTIDDCAAVGPEWVCRLVILRRIWFNYLNYQSIYDSLETSLCIIVYIHLS